MDKSIEPFLKKNKKSISNNTNSTTNPTIPKLPTVPLSLSEYLNTNMSKEDSEKVIKSAESTDASKIIQYLELTATQQQKRDNINLGISIISAIAGIGACIIGLLQLFKS